MTVKDLAAMVTFPTTISIVDKERDVVRFRGDCIELRCDKSYFQDLKVEALSARENMLIAYIKQ